MEKYNPKIIEEKWPSSAKATEGKLSYNPQVIERKWQKVWEESGLYQTSEDDSKEKYYCLDMFPYPSGSGLHVGHWRGFVLSDVVARYQRLNGKNVLHPIGYDAFGLPAENAAIKAKAHPKEFTKKAIINFRRQLKQIGAMFDWSREINTSTPGYYKWTQWLFLQLYKNGLAYKKKAPVNWCPSCQTVLANEQVVSGECERCGNAVAKKDLTQWFFKITDFAEDLLNDLDKIDWPERTKTLQWNWIGKSEGAIVKFKIHNSDQTIDVFTTRPDTLSGATFMVLAPENPIVDRITTAERKADTDVYREKVNKENDIDRTAINKEKTGVFTGAYAINPLNNKQMPIWLSDYVLLSYGTGAVMCVPAHDQRDFEFAKKFDLDIVQVISIDGRQATKLDSAFESSGELINSGKYDGLKSIEAKKKITDDLEKDDLAQLATNYHLRDWLISRQRYWGAPIPIVYCDQCGEVAVPEDQLPVELPQDIEFSLKGDSPLRSSKTFLQTKCPSCGGKALRETDTMDTFVCSSWYYLRYPDPNNDKIFAEKNKIKYWLPVDFYVGGIEHAVLHLLYARFMSKALTQLKIISYSPDGEPFKKLFNIGMIYLNGAKMSKSKGNVVSPDELIKKYGTDALRGYELFIGPADQDSEWQVQGITGIARFLEKIWSEYSKKITSQDKKMLIVEQTIKLVTMEIESIHLNTAISHLMEMFNELKNEDQLSKIDAERIAILFSPFFPHLAEELWQKLGHDKSIFFESWPSFNEEMTKTAKIKIPIQINGKVKDIFKVNIDDTEEQIKKLALNLPKIKAAMENHKIVKTIYVSSKIINFVVK